MACYHPVNVVVRRKPIYGNHRSRDEVTVPCGHCLGCRSDQARDWAIRMMHEGDMHSSAWFVTMTYSPEEMPVNGSLVADDVTRFIKRLREREAEHISYYYCGEYGERSDRPHYHAVLYGAPFLDRDLHTHRHGAPVFVSDLLTECWSHGLCELTGLTYAGALYVGRYVTKKVRKADQPEYYERCDPETGEIVEVAPEFARMSRRPAIGRRWIERYWRDVYPRDYVVMEGKEYKPPRYYDKWLEAHEPMLMMSVREQRYEDAVEIGDDKLIMREKVHRARNALFQGRCAI